MSRVLGAVLGPSAQWTDLLIVGNFRAFDVRLTETEHNQAILDAFRPPTVVRQQRSEVSCTLLLVQLLQ